MASLIPTSGDFAESDAILRGDKLILKGLMFYGFHGVKAEEKTLGQKFLIDIEAWMDLRAAGASDDFSDTVSYGDIYRIAKSIVEGESRDLLEKVAELISSTTLSKFSQISAVRVRVGKPHVAVPGPLDYLGVEILRFRSIDRYKIREEPQAEEAEEEEEEGEEGPPVNEPRLFLPASRVIDPATIDYIAQCSNYLVGGFQHTQQYMHQQAEYGASHINQLNDLYSRWDINQENQVLFPPYPQYSDYPYPPPQWPPHMAPPQYPAPSPPPPPPNDE